MARLNRRTFLRLIGQGTAALGLGIGISEGLHGLQPPRRVQGVRALKANTRSSSQANILNGKKDR